jgi:uncharacterized protein YhhL (DUF1145 family)
MIMNMLQPHGNELKSCLELVFHMVLMSGLCCILFHNGLNYISRSMLDSAAGGAFMTKRLPKIICS